MIVPVGAILKYLVWDFFNMPQTLHNHFSVQLVEAQASIHEQKFLPTLADISDLVSARKALVPAASTIEILNELPIDARVRQAITALSERIELDRFYQRTLYLSSWVAISWLIVIISSLTLFFLYFHSPVGTHRFSVSLLVGVIVLSSLAGGVALVLFLKARNNLVRILGAYRF